MKWFYHLVACRLDDFLFLTWQRLLHFNVCLHKLWVPRDSLSLDYYKVVLMTMEMLTLFSVCDSLTAVTKKREPIAGCARKSPQLDFNRANNPSKLTNSEMKSENIPCCSPAVICQSLSPDFIDEVGPHYLLLPYLKQTNQLLSCSLSLCQPLNLMMFKLKPKELPQTNGAPGGGGGLAHEGFDPRTSWPLGRNEKQPVKIMSHFNALVCINFHISHKMSINTEDVFSDSTTPPSGPPVWLLLSPAGSLLTVHVDIFEMGEREREGAGNIWVHNCDFWVLIKGFKSI